MTHGRGLWASVLFFRKKRTLTSEDARFLSVARTGIEPMIPP